MWTILIFLKASLAIPLAVLVSTLVVWAADKILDAHMSSSEKTGAATLLFFLEFFGSIILYKSFTS